MKIKELRRIESEATPGGWTYVEDIDGWYIEGRNHTVTVLESAMIEKDAIIIAVMRNHLVALLDVAEAAKVYEHAQWQRGLEVSERTSQLLENAHRALLGNLKKLEEI